jgi:hypothetical protein
MPTTAQLDIPQDLLDSARLSLHELKQEFARTDEAPDRPGGITEHAKSRAMARKGGTFTALAWPLH